MKLMVSVDAQGRFSACAFSYELGAGRQIEVKKGDWIRATGLSLTTRCVVESKEGRGQSISCRRHHHARGVVRAVREGLDFSPPTRRK
jgi:hypothetical protein